MDGETDSARSFEIQKDQPVLNDKGLLFISNPVWKKSQISFKLCHSVNISGGNTI